jgi:hypothetical protein
MFPYPICKATSRCYFRESGNNFLAVTVLYSEQPRGLPVKNEKVGATDSKARSEEADAREKLLMVTTTQY